MCAIVGALLNPGLKSALELRDVNWRLNHIFHSSVERGRDGQGWCSLQTFRKKVEYYQYRNPHRNEEWSEVTFFDKDAEPHLLLGNLRAEPTTEFVHQKTADDQQPYSAGNWHVVHNGTIANDKELRLGVAESVSTHIDSAAIVERLASLQAYEPGVEDDIDFMLEHFIKTIRSLKGSFAILAAHNKHPDVMFVACNYRPVWIAKHASGFYFASTRDYFPQDMISTMIEPYTVTIVDSKGPRLTARLRPKANRRALVVCSGGLDSTVAAAWAVKKGYDIELLHFQYGSRAEGPEVHAVKQVAEALDVPLRLFPLPIYKPEDSPLLRADSAIAGGEAGAEFAHEWVPARNLAMLAIATAVAEAGGFDNIILGNNLEEAGAYPDNEPEFINRFNDLLPFAVGDGKRVQVLMPVGNLMKHEIVKLGVELNAPLDKTWSCYRAGHEHCGTCGPCFMRRTAFEINGLPEVISYGGK